MPTPPETLPSFPDDALDHALPVSVPAVIALALAALLLFPGLLPGDDATAPAPSGTSIGQAPR